MHPIDGHRFFHVQSNASRNMLEDSRQDFVAFTDVDLGTTWELGVFSYEDVDSGFPTLIAPSERLEGTPWHVQPLDSRETDLSSSETGWATVYKEDSDRAPSHFSP